MRTYAVRAWWILTPLLFIGWILAPPTCALYVSFDPFWISNTLPSRYTPFVAELVGAYRRTALALLLLGGVAATAHFRRTVAVRGPSLLLPAYVAGIEAVLHFSEFSTRHYYTHWPTRLQLRQSLHIAASASLTAVFGAVVAGAVLVLLCRRGVAETAGSRHFALALPITACVALIWFGADRIFFSG